MSKIKFVAAVEAVGATVKEENMLPYYFAIEIRKEGVMPLKFRKDVTANDNEDIDLIYKEILDGHFFLTSYTTADQRVLLAQIELKLKGDAAAI